MASPIQGFRTYHLGVEETETGVDKDYVDTIFTGIEEEPLETVCYHCNKSAKFKIIPKRECDNTEFMKTKGFLCEECATRKDLPLSPKFYGIRKLPEQRVNDIGTAFL